MNNVYGLIGIGVRNAMWNAGWDKLPKRDGFEIIKGSTYALQYCIKNQWINRGENVLGIKTMQKDGTCSTLKQRYLDLFKKEDTKTDKKNFESKYKKNNDIKKNEKEHKIKCEAEYNKLRENEVGNVRKNLLSCKDILNFGTAYTGANSMSIKGVFQLTDGINKFEDTTIVEEKILSPYGNPKTENPTMATNGTKYTTDEAHYVYDFSLFPKEYDKYICDGFKGYTREEYEDLKQTSLIAVSNYNSKAKAGCKNEFAMFIEVKEDNNYLLDLNCLQDYIEIYKGDKVIYDLTKLIDTEEILNKLEDKIESIEIYYNLRTVEINNLETLKKDKKIRIYDLITREEI